ncbi:SDR family oxidoreductase [Roseateles toxinivorans]|uniref:NAD(P)-dependent dehydrogenase (Short-subunit alcohol dehydrogenase family) n=1 Tax=Roseateles toxinivorans TaxID=270368 RepID=A0A4R6QNG0_9BURK|nr:SDR family oxidoreductase [Roseateles toxinivorans]TDP72370.1 NAD(P)-dependent dehydrogenase (short-subunit alcohol dehydrogenase family) [Roseateles toxinivorans]
MIALITGASRGIGAATALLCAERGYDLALNFARDEASANALAEQVRAMGRRALLVQADVSQEAEVLRMFAAVDAELGPLTALVNNASVVAPGARLEQMTAERMRRVFEVNVLGSFLCAREAVRRMSRSNGGTGGAIVNVSSRAAQLGSPGVYVDYAASKGAIDTFTVGLAREVAGEGIRVNGVRPGIIDTEIHAGGGLGAQLPGIVAGLPMARMGKAQEVAQAIVWLLSDAASYTTGALLDVSGGR